MKHRRRKKKGRRMNDFDDVNKIITGSMKIGMVMGAAGAAKNLF